MSDKNKTKIVCTIGPKTADVQSIEKLIDSGMTMARLNGSHNTLDWHIGMIHLIREVDCYLPILFDLPGQPGSLASRLPTARKSYRVGSHTIFLTCDITTVHRHKCYIQKSTVCSFSMAERGSYL